MAYLPFQLVLAKQLVQYIVVAYTFLWIKSLLVVA